ncbi:MAG: fumarate reductase subunit C [Proteobacteria bacterium]|nr:fumarate reductase subunit C [Pseudomonadota bacterium]
MKLANGNFIRTPAKYTWWLRQGRYLRYILRELSSLFIGIFSILMVWGLYRLSQGEAAFTAWTQLLWGNLVILNIVTLLFAIYHSYTWFMLTPKAMSLKFAGKRIPAGIIIAVHMLLWLLVSAFIWFIYIYASEV